MAILTLRLVEVKSEVVDRPTGCPYCGSAVMQGWGRVVKPVRDPRVTRVEARRYRCGSCGRTFRHYPDGVERADQSVRLQQLAAITWALGLSLRGVTGLFGAFAVRLCHMSVWRDVQRVAEAMRREARKRRVRVLGVDGVYGKVRGNVQGMVIAVDMGTGKAVALAEIDEHDADALMAWLRPLVEQLGVEVIVTDDLGVYGAAGERLGVEHQVCEFHLLRWVGRALRGLEGELGEEYREKIEEVKRIVRELPPDGARQLQSLWESIRPLWRKREGPLEAVHRLRMLILRLAENWERYTLFLRREDIPATNNRTEQAIGRWRVRSKSVRGFKSGQGREAAFWVCSSATT
jgi:transposase-like protein/DNA-directed RNA polymerase subunit RPC12/RpoP